MAAPHSPRRNDLLGALPAPESERLHPPLELVPLPLGEVLYESRDQLQHVYFPTASIVSLPYVRADGTSAEIAVVGNEGIIGIALFMGGETMPIGPWCKARAQLTGSMGSCSRRSSIVPGSSSRAGLALCTGIAGRTCATCHL